MYENDIKEIKKAQGGDTALLEKLVTQNSGLVWNIVRRFNYRGYELEDLYQIGVIGLIKAIKRFDSEFEVQLSTYAVPYILGEIKRFIRDDGPIKVSRSLKELGIKIREVQKEHIRKTGQEIGVIEIAKRLNTTKEEVALALDSMNPVESIYAEKDDSEKGLTLLDSLSSKQDEADDIANQIALKEVINTLEEKEKQIILLRYYKQKTQTQVAKIIGISQVQVSRIEKKVLNAMKLKLTC